jgi:hypothetical protein
MVETLRAAGTAGNVNRLDIRAADRDQWLSIARASPQASFFHTPHWSEIACAAHPDGTDATLMATLPDGQAAVYPVFQRVSESGWAQRLSTFAGCYGGPIAARALTQAEAEALHRDVAAATPGSLFVTLGPLSESVAPRGFSSEEDFTHVVETEGRDFEEVLAGFDRRRRWVYRRGVREGITARCATDSDAAAQYVSLYEETLSRWGEQASSRHPRGLFERMSALAAEEPELIRLWWAELRGEPVTGMWCFYWNRRVVLWHTASRVLEGTSFSPLLSLCAEVIRDAIERGYREVDFNPSGGHGVASDFKRRLGAEQRPVRRLHHVKHSNAASAIAARVRSAAQSLGLARGD